MKVMVIGSGAREHALVWKLNQSSHVDSIVTVPGNAGTAPISTNVPASLTDLAGLADLARERRVDFTIVGPDNPLADGIVDLFRERGLPILGPSREAARIEWSKSFASKLMEDNDIPHPERRVFDRYADARDYALKHNGPIVVKADGLALGKGVFVCPDPEVALGAIHQCMVERVFGPAGDRIVLEEYLSGPEVSVFAFSDGSSISSLVAACDYKRIYEGDEGPNTGGMGSYATPEFWTPSLEQKVRDTIMVPTISALAGLGTPFRGVLYAGIMITPSGPQVLEFNSRLGDPEAQVILPLLETDLLQVLAASAVERLDHVNVRWGDLNCVGVVLASPGYPGEYPTGYEIEGLADLDEDVFAFHAGTKLESRAAGEVLVTSGGRVMTIVAQGASLEEARIKAYDNVRRVSFPGVQYRRDIAIPGVSVVR